MRIAIVFIFAIIFFGSCTRNNTKQYPLLDLVPENTSILLKINNLSTFKSELRNTKFLADASNTEIASKLDRLNEVLNHIASDTTCLVAVTERDSLHFLLVIPDHPDWLTQKDSSLIADSLNTGPQSFVVNKARVYSALDNGIRIVSSSETLLNEALSGKNASESTLSLQDLYKTSLERKSATLFINTQIPIADFPSFFEQDSLPNQKFLRDWIMFDINSNQNHLYLNGLVKTKDTIGNFLSLFEGTKPIENITPVLAGPDTDAIVSYTFDDYEIFAKNQQSYSDSPYNTEVPLNGVEEVGIIFQNGQKAVVLNAYATESVQKYLDKQATATREYQGHQITTIKKIDFLSETFYPLITGFRSRYYSILADYYVFSENEQLLENLIANSNSGTSFAQSPIYLSAKDALTVESNMLFVSNADGLKYAAKDVLSAGIIEEIMKSNPEQYVYSSQLVADKGFYHSHFSVSSLLATTKSGTTAPLFSIQLDSDLATDPQFVTNHRTNKKEIVVQDVENNLYLISTEGKVLWKKQLQGQIQGKIHQVDLYKNGRLQLAFTTSDQFLILDRNGKEVMPFKKSYPGGNLNPLAVFDYDKTRNYRFVVTQGSKVMMYNSKGNIVSGFTYTEAESPVIAAPKHIRIGQRDYLVLKLENGRLKILNRVGADRISVDKEFQFSDNDVFLYRGKFILTDKNGILHSIDSKGTISESKLNLNEDHGMDATVKTLVTLNENILSIKGKSTDLELGVYLKPRIFYIYDKIYVTATDIQSGLIYLFDSGSRSVSSFPVYGNSRADMADMDNNSSLELVTKDQDNSLIVYSIR